MKKGDPFAGLPRPSLYGPKWTVKVKPPRIKARVVSTSVDMSTPVVDKRSPGVDKSPKAVDTVDTVVDRHPPPLKYKRAASAEEKRKAYQREWLRSKRMNKIK